MNSSVLWVIMPITMGGILLLFRRQEKAVAAVGTGIALLLALLANVLPIGNRLPFLPSITIQDTLVILGRQFIITDADRTYLILTFLIVAMWFAGSPAARAGRFLVPSGLIVSGLLVAALAVEPPLYAALLIEMAALISIPVLAPPGKPTSRGVLRFITFQTLGMPFILSSGWFLPTVVADPFSRPIITALVLMLLGFAFLTAIFPFHTWLINLTSETNPYSTAFIFFILLSNIGLFGITFINRIEWLRNFALLYEIIRLMGSLMVFISGLWVAFERDLGRIMGYAMLSIVGISLLALSLGQPTIPAEGIISATGMMSIDFFIAFFIPNVLALAVWSLALSIIRSQAKSLDFDNVQGLAFQLPFASAGILAANFSLASLPLLAGYPLFLSVLSRLNVISLPVTIFTILGIGGLMIAALRTIAVLFSTEAENPSWSFTESRLEVIFILSGVSLLILFGLLPQIAQTLSNISIP